MLVIRPVRSTDVDSFELLVNQTPYGLSSLPKNRAFLEERIANSLFTFNYNTEKPSGGSFLFVLEDLPTGRILGSCGIVSKVGGFEPFYAYSIESIQKQVPELNLQQNLRVLHLHRDHSGPCEVGSLFLLPQYRQKGVGRFLSLSRFMFMAQFPKAFDPSVVAKLRGVITDTGESLFWEAVGRQFFGVDFATADHLTALDKRILAELMPTYPIYIDLLPPEAQQIIGQVDPQTAGAMRILRGQGFEVCDMVDLFEAGPIMRAALHDIHVVRESRVLTVRSIERWENEKPTHLVSNTHIHFRIAMGAIRVEGGEAVIPMQLADALQVDEGMPVRVYPL